MIEKYEFWKIEEKWQGEWEREESFRVDEGSPPSQVLPAGDVPVSFGAHPHGARAQLLHR